MSTGSTHPPASILHVDMDAFFAAVEVRDNPDLRGKAVIVGGLGSRAVVTSATYEARAYGVKSAMPVSRALRLCPIAIVVPPVHEKYTAASKAIMSIFDTITPHVEPVSVDEAFLDVASARRRLGDPVTIAEHIRAQIAAEQGLTASVGIGANKLVAKIASGRCKPNGLLHVPADRTQDFLRPLPATALWGVGAKTAATLERLGLRTVADIADTGEALLTRALGPAAGAHVYALACGRDERPVQRGRVEKSVGAHHTFETDVADPAQLRATLLALSNKVARRTRAAGYVARGVTVTIRYADFSTITRSKKMVRPSDAAHDIFETATGIWDRVSLKTPWIRLLGVRCDDLIAEKAFEQQLFLGEPDQGWREAEQAADRVVTKFGPGMIRPASLIKPQD